MLPMPQWPSLEIIDRQFQRSTFAAWRSIKEIDLDKDFLYNQEKFKNDQILGMFLEKSIQRLPNLKSISGFSELTNKNDPIGNSVFNLLAQFSFLENIRFGDVQFDLASLTEFLKTSKSRGKLKEFELKLKLEDHSNMQELFRSAFIDSDSPSLQLETITFLDHPKELNISYEFIDTINVSKLTTLKFPASETNLEDFISLINRCTKLEKIDITLTETVQKGKGERLTLKLFDAITTTMPSENLSALKLRKSDEFYVRNDDEVFVQIRSQLGGFIRQLGRRYRLLKFSLAGGYFYNDDIIRAIADNMIYLTSLKLTFLIYHHDSLALSYLVTKLTQLEKLTLTNRIIDDMVISTLAAHLNKLKKLRLDYPLKDKSEMFNCLGSLVKLEKLRINSGRMSNNTMKAWNGFGGNLRSLELPWCSIGGYRALIDLLKKSPYLRRIDLEYTQITDTSLTAIASLCPLLEDLDLAGCKKITSAGVQAVADGCRRLKRLELSTGESEKLKFEDVKFGKYRKIKFVCLTHV